MLCELRLARSRCDLGAISGVSSAGRDCRYELFLDLIYVGLAYRLGGLVKAEIARRRAEEERAMPRSRSRLPQLGAARPSNLPASPEEHIDIRDLTWDDRERTRCRPQSRHHS